MQETNPQLPGDAAAQAVSTSRNVELQHLAIVAFGGELFHSRWNSQGEATQFGDVQATAAGRVGAFMDVDAAHGPDRLHVLGCTVDGRLWHTIRMVNGTWLPFVDVQAVPGQRKIGSVRNVACAYETPAARKCAETRSVARRSVLLWLTNIDAIRHPPTHASERPTPAAPDHQQTP